MKQPLKKSDLEKEPPRVRIKQTKIHEIVKIYHGGIKIEKEVLDMEEEEDETISQQIKSGKRAQSWIEQKRESFLSKLNMQSSCRSVPKSISIILDNLRILLVCSSQVKLFQYFYLWFFNGDMRDLGKKENLQPLQLATWQALNIMILLLFRGIKG